MHYQGNKMSGFTKEQEAMMLEMLEMMRGMVEENRKFQHNYSELTARFSSQLSSKEKWRWGPDQDTTFELIKEKFLDTVMLHLSLIHI